MNEKQFTELVNGAELAEQVFNYVPPDNSEVDQQAKVTTVWRNGDVTITYKSNVVICKDGLNHEQINMGSAFGYTIEGVDVQDWMYGVCSSELDYTWNYDEVYAYLLDKQKNQQILNTN